jgi:hypothetical protein
VRALFVGSAGARVTAERGCARHPLAGRTKRRPDGRPGDCRTCVEQRRAAKALQQQWARTYAVWQEYLDLRGVSR